MSLCCSELKLVVVLLLLPLAWAAAAAAVANNDGAFLDSEHQEMSTSNTFPNSDCRNISIGQSEKNRSVPPLSSQANPPQLQHHWCDLWLSTNLENRPDDGAFPWYDMVAITDDVNYGEGRGEDMALVHAMRRLGRRATRISIQDDDFDFSTRTKMVIIRSAWSRYEYPDEYLRFLETMDQSAILMNPLSVIQWQADKAAYLQQLQAAGVPVPPTLFVNYRDDSNDDESYLFDWDDEPTPKDMHAIQQKLGCKNVVMKPTGGNGGVGVRLYPGDHDFFEELYNVLWLGQETVIFQCYQHHIETRGERGIVVVAGQVTHGILKMPAEDDYLVNTDFGGTWSLYDPTQKELQFAQTVFQKVKELTESEPAYLRVDVIDDNDGNLVLMELAAGTANIWLEHKPEAANLLAAYLDQQLQK